MFAQPFLPKNSTGGGLETMGDARVRNHKEVVPFRDRRGDVGNALVGPPDDVRVSDVAGSVGTDRENVVVGVAAGDKEEVGLWIVNDRGYKLFGGAVDDPVPPSGIGIVASHAFVAGEDH